MFGPLHLFDRELDLGHGVRVGLTAVLCRVEIELAARADDAEAIGVQPFADGIVCFVDGDKGPVVDGAGHGHGGEIPHLDAPRTRSNRRQLARRLPDPHRAPCNPRRDRA